MTTRGQWFIEFLGMPRSGPYGTRDEAVESARMVISNTGHRTWVFREVDRDEVTLPPIYNARCPKCKVPMDESADPLRLCPKCKRWFIWVPSALEFHDFDPKPPETTT